MFADPQTVTINTVSTPLARIVSNDPNKGVFQSADLLARLTIGHTNSGDRTRHLVRFDIKDIAADPLTAVNSYQNLGIYLVIDQPIYGFGVDDVKQCVGILKTFLSDANIAKVVGLES